MAARKGALVLEVGNRQIETHHHLFDFSAIGVRDLWILNGRVSRVVIIENHKCKGLGRSGTQIPYRNLSQSMEGPGCPSKRPVRFCKSYSRAG
jgi:hypothetical protein